MTNEKTPAAPGVFSTLLRCGNNRRLHGERGITLLRKIKNLFLKEAGYAPA